MQNLKRLVLATTLVVTTLISYAQNNFGEKLSAAAIQLTNNRVVYDPAYFTIKYPNGDVPSNKGVCTDVVIRAYRTLGIDLQKEVHEDMEHNFSKYPKTWKLTHTDKNIDHRRVPNLMVFYTRNGKTKPTSNNTNDYAPWRYCVLEFRRKCYAYWNGGKQKIS